MSKTYEAIYENGHLQWLGAQPGAGRHRLADQLQQAIRLLAYFDEIPLHEPVVQRTITLRNSTAYDCQTR